MINDKLQFLIKSFCGCFTDRGGFFKKSPLAAGGMKIHKEE
jgi:hypothetical protein